MEASKEKATSINAEVIRSDPHLKSSKAAFGLHMKEETFLKSLV